MHATARVKLPLVQLRLAPGARHPQDRQRPERVELGDDERGLEVLGSIVHRLVDGAGAQHLAERVDRPVVIHDPAVGSFSRTSSSSRPRTLCGLTRLLIGRAPGRRPYSRLASLISAWRVQSSRTSGRSTTTPCERHAARRMASRSSRWARCAPERAPGTSGSLRARSSADLPQDRGVAGDVDLAVEMLGIAREPRQLQVDQTQHDLRRADLGAERQRPARGDLLEQIAGSPYSRGAG